MVYLTEIYQWTWEDANKLGSITQLYAVITDT